jgi:ABC-type nitrate/sulfonate/bicarbonate transport system substrate-binding protein
VVEATYRLVANKASGIRTLADFKGKKIGTFKGTSAEVFINSLLGSAGLESGDYTTVSGNICMKAPCGSNTFPAQLKSKQLDAFGCWETAVELGIEAVGEENVVIFKNGTVYREIYSLYATAENLKNPATRKEIVQYVKALNTTLAVFKERPEEVYPFVARTIGVDVPVLRKVWADHKWGPGDMGEGLVDFLEREERYLSKVDRRKAATREELKRFIDTSVYEEAMLL